MTTTALDPRPSGWFAVGFSSDLPRGASSAGILAAAPYRLARRRDGTLDHHGAIGALSEQNGVLLAWHHPRGEAPTWRVPVLPDSDFRKGIQRRLRARSHPQETFENSIDVAHFPTIHGYSDIEVLEPMRCDGPRLRVRYRIARAHPIPFVRAKITPTFEVRLHGIGCAHNHIELPDLGARVRMLALSTPTDPGQVDIRLSIALSRSTSLPLQSILAVPVERGVARGIEHDFRQDIAVWERKRYASAPVLCADDGPIGPFRQWCRQFYEGDSA